MKPLDAAFVRVCMSWHDQGFTAEQISGMVKRDAEHVSRAVKQGKKEQRAAKKAMEAQN